MFRGALLLFASLLVASFATAESSKLAIFMNGKRVGSSIYSDGKAVFKGKEVQRGDSKTTMSIEMMGNALEVEVTSTTWSEIGTGRPIRMTFVTKSAGRTQTVEADFGEKYADIVMTSGGPKQTKRLLIPTDAPIVDDPMPMVLQGKINTKQSFYQLRPETMTFSKDQVVNMGPKQVTVGTQTYDATLVDVVDSMTTLHIYVSSSGQLVKAVGPLGIEFVPESLAVAMEGSSTKSDLALASATRPDKPIKNPRYLTRLKFSLEAPGAKNIPSDAHQTVTKNETGWRFDVHPVASTSPGVLITEAAKQMPAWVKSDTYIPSDEPPFKSLAKEIFGNEKRVQGAAFAVQKWVSGRMRPNLGIGVLRDATEVLSSKEGVCRDYAILTATILRAGGVPTRLCSGLVTWEGPFFYHAWVEVWNGKNWIGVDSTVPDRQMSAGHIKLANGNIATAFQFPVLDQVSIRVEEAVSR